jgi:uncharacterized protein
MPASPTSEMASTGSIAGLNRTFWNPESSTKRQSYRLLPFHFGPLDKDRYVMVGIGGDYYLVDRDTLYDLIHHRLSPTHPAYDDLAGRLFLTPYQDGLAEDMLASHYKTRMSHLPELTGLHIFVVTLRCDHTCQYCQVSRVSSDRDAFDMSKAHAEAALKHVFRSPNRAIKIEFQGGEPLLNFPLIKFIVERSREINDRRNLQFVITSNLVFLTDEILAFCKEHAVYFSTSLDGPAQLHNQNRPRPGRDSYEKTLEGISRVRSALGHDAVAALMTTTQESLGCPEAIVGEYVRQGFSSIFLRYLSPYGFAIKSAKKIGYETEAFLEFYKRALDYIIGLNKKGVRLVESYTSLILKRILTPYPTRYVDLQSPAGMGLGVMVYNYDGSVYASDEARMLAEMGDKTFRLGSVFDSYDSLFLDSPLLPILYDSMVETVPMCSDCPFQSYCGTDPVFHHRTQGDVVGSRPTSAFCRRNMEVIKHVFRLLHDDHDASEILRSWVR